MAFFAMLAILASPALAFACCCAQESAPMPVHVAPASQKTNASHPGCHGHSGPQDGTTSSASTPRPSHSNAVAGVTSSQSSSFKGVCGCPHPADNALTFVETQNSSSFSPLVLGLAVQAFSPSLNLPSSVRFAFASNAAKPRSPGTSRKLGRGPPAFSLLS